MVYWNNKLYYTNHKKPLLMSKRHLLGWKHGAIYLRCNVDICDWWSSCPDITHWLHFHAECFHILLTATSPSLWNYKIIRYYIEWWWKIENFSAVLIETRNEIIWSRRAYKLIIKTINYDCLLASLVFTCFYHIKTSTNK